MGIASLEYPRDRSASECLELGITTEKEKMGIHFTPVAPIWLWFRGANKMRKRRCSLALIALAVAGLLLAMPPYFWNELGGSLNAITGQAWSSQNCIDGRQRGVLGVQFVNVARSMPPAVFVGVEDAALRFILNQVSIGYLWRKANYSLPLMQNLFDSGLKWRATHGYRHIAVFAAYRHPIIPSFFTSALFWNYLSHREQRKNVVCSSVADILVNLIHVSEVGSTPWSASDFARERLEELRGPTVDDKRLVLGPEYPLCLTETCDVDDQHSQRYQAANPLRYPFRTLAIAGGFPVSPQTPLLLIFGGLILGGFGSTCFFLCLDVGATWSQTLCSLFLGIAGVTVFHVGLYCLLL